MRNDFGVNLQDFASLDRSHQKEAAALSMPSGTGLDHIRDNPKGSFCRVVHL